MLRDQKEHRRNYTYRHANERWEILIADEPNDLVIKINYLDAEGSEQTWIPILRADQGSHRDYHIHLHGESKKISIARHLTREDKILAGLQKIKELSAEGRLTYKGSSFPLALIPPDIIEKVLAREIVLGSTNHSISIGGTAHIIAAKDSLTIKVFNNQGKLKDQREIGD